MQPSASWITRTGALLLAVVCGAVLLPLLSLLVAGYAVRALGSGVVNLVTLLQNGTLTAIAWADAKLFHPGAAHGHPGQTKPE